MTDSPRQKNNVSTAREAQPAAPAPRAGKAAGRTELKKSAATRQRILDAAASIFAQKGYGRTLMSEIGQAAGIHTTALYYHFSTKDDLAEGVVTYIVRATYDDVVRHVRALPPNVSFVEKLRAAIHAQLDSIVTRRDYVLSQSKVLSELDDVRLEKHRAVLDAWASFWRKLLQQGRRDGVIRRDLDVSVARMILQGSIAWTIEWYRPGGRSVREIADEITDVMLNGMLVRGAASKQK